jgi:hypothetical protein
MRLSLVLALAAAVPAFSLPLRLSGGPKSEDKLRRFIDQNKDLKARLEDAARREAGLVAAARESDLRDSVSDATGHNLRRGLEQSEGAKREALLRTLPGMQAPVPQEQACLTIVDCPSLDMALDVPDAQLLPETLRRMVRPWMLLQHARGSSLELSPLSGPGEATLSVRLKNIDAKPLVINVAPQLLGGFKVWFDSPFVLAELYNRERNAVLYPVR